MNAQPYPHENRCPQPQNDFWVDFAFKGLLIFFFAAMGLLLLPAVVVAAAAAVLFGLLRLKWWTLLIAALVVFGIFTALDVDPIKRAEKVFRRSQNVWSSDTANPFEKLWRKGDRLWRLGLPATIPSVSLSAPSDSPSCSVRHSGGTRTATLRRHRRRLASGGGRARPFAKHPTTSEVGLFSAQLWAATYRRSGSLASL